MTEGAAVPGPAPREERADAVVLGAGVAGLWCAWALVRAGLGVRLIEPRALGAGQTGWSQGIIHGGVKYRLPGASAHASAALVRAADRWREALTGGSDRTPNLHATKVLARQTCLWTTSSASSRLAARGAALAMRSGVLELRAEQRPPVFANAPPSIRVYRADEPVLDSRSLLSQLARALPAATLRTGNVERIECAADRVRVALADGSSIGTPWLVLAAGCGNEHLLSLAGVAEQVTQRRPLHMVYAKPAPHELHGHCLGLSSVPRLTVTTASGPTERVWALGGALAEEGAIRDEQMQLRAARLALRECVPWVHTDDLMLLARRVDRCEARSADGRRPDGPVVRRWGPVIGVWPTKLALAPIAADQVMQHISAAGAGLDGAPTGARPAPPSPAPASNDALAVADAPWEGDQPWM